MIQLNTPCPTRCCSIRMTDGNLAAFLAFCVYGSVSCSARCTWRRTFFPAEADKRSFQCVRSKEGAKEDVLYQIANSAVTLSVLLRQCAMSGAMLSVSKRQCNKEASHLLRLLLDSDCSKIPGMELHRSLQSNLNAKCQSFKVLLIQVKMGLCLPSCVYHLHVSFVQGTLYT